MDALKYQLFGRLSDEEYAALEADIRKRGVMVPVEKDEDGEILDGHHRKEIADRLGIPYPEVVRHFATEGEKREHVIKMNLARRHLNPVRWGQAFLLLLEERGAREGPGRPKASDNSLTFGELCEEVGVNPKTAEYRVQQARAYESLPEPIREQVDQGDLTLPQARREVKREEKRGEMATRAERAGQGKGPAWQILHGDCLDELRKLKRGSVRLIFADPPYNQGVDYGAGKEADSLPDAEYLWWCDQWLFLCHEALADDGSLWVLISHEYAAVIELLLRGTYRLEYMDHDDPLSRVLNAGQHSFLTILTGMARLHVRSWITWYESFGVNCTNKFNRCSRRLLHCVKDPSQFVFHPEAVARPSDRQTKYNDARADPGGKLWDDVWQIPRLTGTCAERIPDFPTQLPLALLTPIVACATDPGDLVLDPFSGSATTGEAALRLGRRYIGIEKQKKFVELSTLRLKEVSGGL